MRMRMKIIEFIRNYGFLSWNFIQQEGITLRGLVQPMLVRPGQTRPGCQGKRSRYSSSQNASPGAAEKHMSDVFFLWIDLNLQVNLLHFCLQHWESQSQSNKNVFQAMANMKLQKTIWNWSLGRWAGTYVLEALTAMAPAELPVRSHFWRMLVPF